MSGRFWSESFWLPSNTTWEDVTNGPDKTRVYADIEDFRVQIPLVILSLALRFLCERYLFVPLGKYFRINGVKAKSTPDPRLEAEYRKSSKCKNAASIAKQLDLTERQIERWWRLRRSQDKPTTLVKFCENMWKGCYFLFNVSLGLYVVWGQVCLLDVEKYTYAEYPHHGITPAIWWFYMIGTAFYISLVITQFRDVRRKDFWPMFFHHYATITLLVLSWVTQSFRMGCLVMIVHDAADIALEFGKASKYAKLSRTVDCIFAVFVTLWVVTRLVLFPFYILPIVYRNRSTSPVVYLMFLLLAFIVVLTCYWTWLIFLVVKRTLWYGKLTTDLRSSESEDSDVSSSHVSKEDAKSN